LIQVEMVGAQMLQGAAQFGLRARARPFRRLAGEKDAVALAFERRAELLLRLLILAVAGRDIEIGDAAIQRLAHESVGLLLCLPGHDDSAESDDRKLPPGAPQCPVFHCLNSFRLPMVSGLASCSLR